MKTIKSIAELDAVRDYLSRVGASVRSLRTAVVEQRKGKYWTDIAVIRFSTKGEVTTEPAYEPTEAEQDAIKVAFAGVEMPEHVHPAALPSIPDEVQALYDAGKRDSVYEFRDVDGNFIMFQYKATRDGADRADYIPWTYWSDGQWRKMEPEDKLPLYNIELAKGQSTVFLHEGAKGARVCQTMIERATPEAKLAYDNHPWAEELSTGVHLGWIGGALNPSRTDWNALKKCGVKRVIIIADNDPPGKAAVPKIAYYLHVPTFSIEFSNDFPSGFDLGDPFPESMFDWSEEDNRRVYIGNAMTAYLHNATWATTVRMVNNKPVIELREHFRDMWAYAEQHELFVNKLFTNMRYTEQQINAVLAPFYNGKSISKLMLKSYTGRTVRFAYRPDTPERVITNYDQTSINLHTPSSIRPLAGSTKPWLEFLEYLIPNERDRKFVERWCATLIARPETRMGYAMLLMSEAQGVGKTTLANAVLEPIVGRHNTDQTSERDIVESQFTDWIAEKRLVVVNEIYSGHSWKAYHKLKTFITDAEVKVNKKYQTPYTVENWAHIFACSNSKSALRMDDDDRRWLCPQVTEVPWPRERFNRFYRWLKGPGLGIIMRWATEYGDYVTPGERAPMTAAKADLIVESLTDAGKALRDLALAMIDDPRPMALTMADAMRWLREDRTIRLVETEHELRKPMKAVGLQSMAKQMKLEGRLTRLFYNQQAANVAREAERGDPEAMKTMRSYLVRPQDLITGDF